MQRADGSSSGKMVGLQRQAHIKYAGRAVSRPGAGGEAWPIHTQPGRALLSSDPPPPPPVLTPCLPSIPDPFLTPRLPLRSWPLTWRVSCALRLAPPRGQHAPGPSLGVTRQCDIIDSMLRPHEEAREAQCGATRGAASSGPSPTRRRRGGSTSGHALSHTRQAGVTWGHPTRRTLWQHAHALPLTGQQGRVEAGQVEQQGVPAHRAAPAPHLGQRPEGRGV